jgi:hypothetical protein
MVQTGRALAQDPRNRGKAEKASSIFDIRQRLVIFDGSYETYYGPSFRFPRAVQNISLSAGTRLNSLTDSARPGEFIALWGTGLSAAPGDQTAGPVPGPLNIPALAVFGRWKAREDYLCRKVRLLCGNGPDRL